MANDTKIAWCHATFSPWFGCSPISPACDNCYAEALTLRRKWADGWGPHADRQERKGWHGPRTLNSKAERAGTRYRIFCASVADVFDNHRSIKQAWRDRLWELIRTTPHLDWLLLTKRPQLIERYLPDTYPNVWLGITAENQEELERRMPYLAATPAVVRFISYEPALGPLALAGWATGIDWVICGGESGPNARPIDLRWAEDLRDECRATNTAFFMKQMSGRRFPLPPIPEGLNIQEFPRGPELAADGHLDFRHPSIPLPRPRL